MSDLRHEAQMWMTQMLKDNPHLSATALAEGTAAAIGKESWLDREIHWLWDLAVDMLEASNEQS